MPPSPLAAVLPVAKIRQNACRLSIDSARRTANAQRRLFSRENCGSRSGHCCKHGVQPLNMAAIKAEFERRLLNGQPKPEAVMRMPRIDRSRLVEEDLLAIAEWIAQNNASAARHWLNDIESKFELLARHPSIGESVSHLNAGWRRISHGQYVIFFEPRAMPHGVRIVATCSPNRRHAFEIDDLVNSGL